MKSNRFAVLLIAMFVASHVLAVGAQEKSRQDKGEIRLSTELVQIDVLVTDQNKKPVPGLVQGDFELYDNT